MNIPLANGTSMRRKIMKVQVNEFLVHVLLIFKILKIF